MKKQLQTLVLLLATASMSGARPAGQVPEGGWAFPEALTPETACRTAPTDGDLRTLPGICSMPEANEELAQFARRLQEKNQILLGYNTNDYRGVPIGMFKITTLGSFDYLYTLEYSRKNYNMNLGWVRNGKACSIFRYGTQQIDDLVYVESDLLTGEVTDSKKISLTDPETGFYNYHPNYISCAYDPTDDSLWGYSTNTNGSGYAFVTSPNGDVQQTVAINDAEEWLHVCASICYNKKENALVGVNRNNDLVKIDRDGTQTVIMPLGVRTEYARTALFYDDIDECYYWFAQMSEGGSGIYVIDPKGNSLTQIVNMDNRLELPFMTVVDAEKDPAPISKPIIDKFDFGKGQNDGTISIFMPQTMFSGEPVTGQITWHAYIDDTEYSSGTAEAGSRVNVDFTAVSDGYHTFAFDVEQNQMKSSRSSKKYFVGYDTPSKPQNVVLTGTTVSWDPVIRGLNGGYLDHQNLTYHVYINNLEVGQVVNATSFEWISENDALYAGYSARVEADNHGHVSESSDKSAFITFGKPWPMDFHVTPTETESWAFTSLDLDEDGDSFGYNEMNQDGEKVLCFRESLNWGGSDDWLFSPPIQFDSVDSFYEVSFEVSNFAVYYPNLDLQAYLCTDIDPESVIATLYDAVPAADRIWHPVSKLFNITSPGIYYLAFHVYRADRSVGNGVRVRDISIKDTHISAPLPSAVTELKAWGGKKGKLTAEVQFRMPEKYLNGDAIPEDATIDVELTVNGTEYEPKKLSGKSGQTLTAFLTTEQGINEIIAVPSIDGLVGQSTSVRVYCGYDIPGPATNVAGWTSEDNLSLHVTWDRPTEDGDRGYYVDPTKVEYAIMRYTDEGWVEWETVGSDVFEYTLTVDANNGLKSEWIGIAPKNVAGRADSYAWMSDMLGTPWSLPAKETYFGGTPNLNPIRIIRNDDPNRMTDWGFADPKNIVGECPYSIALVGSVLEAPAGCMLMLPKFSTEGLHEAGMSLNLWTGNNMADVAIYGDTYGYDSPVKLFDIPKGSGWATYAFRLPEDLQNRKWITLYISAAYNTSNQIVMVTDYEVADGLGSGVRSVADGGCAITGGEVISVTGYQGETVKIYTIDGQLIRKITDAPSDLSIPVAPGIYVVVTDTKSAKVITY